MPHFHLHTTSPAFTGTFQFVPPVPLYKFDLEGTPPPRLRVVFLVGKKKTQPPSPFLQVSHTPSAPAHHKSFLSTNPPPPK